MSIELEWSPNFLLLDSSWVTSQGYRPSQALMVWKLIYGNNSRSIWAHSCEELEGLNKDLAMMLSKFAKLKALQVKDIITATDGTRKVNRIILDYLLFVPEFEHPEDLVPAKEEAPASLLPSGFLSPRIRPLSPKALRAEINAIASSLYHSLHPSRTPPLLPITLSTPSTSHRAGIPEADTPPRNRPLLATPRPGCEVEESYAAAARRPGLTMAHGVDCS
nr:dual-specificity RNA methyltransferase RlmN isoform X2 [Tanacetum cinerariifolium]